MIVRLGSVPTINTKVVEGLFASDLSHLQTLYERLNGIDDPESFGTDANGHDAMAMAAIGPYPSVEP